MLNVRNVSGNAQTIDASRAIGSDTFINDRSAGQLDFVNIKAGDVVVNGDAAATVAATNIAVSATVGNALAAAADSVTDAFKLSITNGVVGGNNIYVNDTNADWTAATIVSSGSANTVGSINLSGLQATAATHTVKDLTIEAGSALAATSVTGFDTTAGVTNTITISGAAAATATNTGVSIGTLAGAVDVVNASGLTVGGLTATLSAATQTVTGGAGNDRITTGGVVLTTGSVDAGAGTADRLIVTASADITAVTGAKYKNFEVLQVENSVSVDLDHVAGITGIRINGGAAATGVTDLSATQAGNVTVVGTGAGPITIGVKNATDVGQIDTLALTIDDGLAAKNTIALGTPTLNGIENISINAVDNVTVAALTSAAALTKLTLTGAGDQTITTGALALNPNTVIDGSAATGVLTINAALATTNPLAITGGTAADVITTSAQADVVNGKGGLDSITITAGTATVQSEVTAAADADLVTGFVTGTNKFDYNGVLANGTASAPGITTTGTSEVLTSATTFAAALTDVAAASNSIVFIAQGDIAAGAGGTALTTLAGAFTAANITAFESALVGTGGALNGAITNLDTVLGATDAVLLVLDNGTHSAVLRITNTDTSTVNTLTAAEIEVVGVFNGTAALAAADFI